MAVCPVCEDRQAVGEDCQVCGRRLGGPELVPASVDRLEGLETTALEDGGSAAVAALPDLEPTGHPAAPGGTVPPGPEIEPTRIAPVQVRVQPVPDLEPTQGEPIPGDAPTARPATLTCRYCRNENPPTETLCGWCGMKLPVFGVAAGAVLLLEPAEARCFSCGRLGLGQVCTGCGALLRHG